MDLRVPPPTDVGSERRRALATVALFAAIATLAALDLVGDLRDGTTPVHAVVEGGIVLAGAVGIALVLRRLVALGRRVHLAEDEARALAVRLDATRAEADAWRAEVHDLLDGLGAAIERQLARWGLTAAEKDVAFLLLKGLSHKEIAAARRVGEATVRQQAAAIYKKAGLGGRHDLAAFFLEDLVPGPQT